MKKLFLVAFMLAASLFIFGACANDGNGNADAAVPAPGEPVPPLPVDPDADPIVLRVSESLGATEDFIRAAGEAFTARYPHITIEFVNVEIGGAVGQIEVDGPLGIGPDVFVAPHDQMGALIAGGHILPAAPAVADWVRNLVFESAAAAVTFDGLVYGFPIAMETYALFYNRDLIDTPPTTFEGVVEFSREFNAANPGMHGFIMDIGAYYSIIFTTADGNRLFGPYGTDRQNSNINSTASVRGMEFFQSLREILDVDAGDLTTAFADASFIAGQAAMHMTGPWNIAPFTDYDINFGVTTLPSLPGQTTPPASFAGVRTVFVSAFTEHFEEASAFAQFLISPEIQQLRYQLTGAIPSTTVPTDNEHFPGFFRQLEYAFPMPSIPEMGAYWAAMNAASANIWNGMNIQEQLDMANSAMIGN